MNRRELSTKIRKAVYVICHEKGYGSAIDVLFYLNQLDKQDYEKWRRGKVIYIERVIKSNLAQTSFALSIYILFLACLFAMMINTPFVFINIADLNLNPRVNNTFCRINNL